MEPVLQLSPDTNPADRLTDYTVSIDPWRMFILKTFRDVKAFYLQQYGYVPSQVPVRFVSGSSGSTTGSSTGAHGIELSNDLQTAVHYWPEFTIAHEYAHWLQLSVIGSNEFFNLALCRDNYHPVCDTTFCPRGVWLEGMADGMAEFYTHTALDTTFIYCKSQFNCYHNSICVPEVMGVNEANVSNYVYAISSARPDAFMHTYRSGLVTLNGLTTSHVATFAEFHGVWQDQNPEPVLIAAHAPGVFDATQMANWFIYHTGVTTGVQTEVVGTRAARIESANPVRNAFRIVVDLPSSRGARIMLFDVQGRVVREAPLPRVGRKDVGVGDLAAGVYFVRVSDRGRAILTRKIVVVR
jgi:hypothetical protein